MILKNNKNKSNITFVLFVRNEEKRIEYPLKCFSSYGKMLVSDNSSTDRTVEIAKRYGAKVIKRTTDDLKNFAESSEESNYVLKHVKTDWVFWGFADDMVPKTCLELYKKISQENKYKIVVQKRKTLMFDGKTEIHSGLINIKFFRKDSIDFTNNTIHQMGKFASHVKPEEILYLPPVDEYATYHFSTDTSYNFIPKIDIYTSIQAQSNKDKITYLKLIIFPLSTFIEVFFLYGSCRYGIKGFIGAMRFCIVSFLEKAKKYELDHKITENSIEKQFLNEKNKLLKYSPQTNLITKCWANFLIIILSGLHKHYKFNQIKK